MRGAQPGACPVCGGAPDAIFDTLYGHRPTVAGVPLAMTARPVIRRCGSCRARWVDPAPSAEALADCYRAAGTGVWHDDPQTAAKRRFDERWRRLLDLAPRPAALEVGCYTGGFLAGLPSSWERVGVEPAEAAAEQARALGLTVHTATLDRATLPPDHFGAAIAFDVLEHLTDPHAFVAQLRDTLVEGGVLLLETGDAESRFARHAGRFWSYYHLPEHVLFFTPDAATHLLERQGFRVLEIERDRHHKRPDPKLHARRALTAAAYAAVSGAWETVARRPAPLRRWQAPWLVHKDHMLVWAQKR